VIGLAAFLLIVAVGLLAGGLAQGSAALQWGSFAASLLAALVLGIGELRRRRASPEPAESAADADRPGAVPAEVPAMAGASAAEGTAAVEPQSPAQPIAEPAPVATASAHSAERTGPATGAHAAVPAVDPDLDHAAVPALDPALGPDGEPPVEEVEVTDLLLVLDLTDEVLVVDEHPRYHVAGCPHLDGVETIPMPMVEARTDGFSPCGTCAPDHQLAERERTRRAG
jgi:hypothetical protein